MAQKKPSKIMFCHFCHPKPEELAEYKASCLKQATYAVKLHNDQLVANGGMLQDEFYFLNTTINGETHIITAAGQRNYPTNDPQIVAKLEAYLAGYKEQPAGNAHKRGTWKHFDPEIGEDHKLDKQTFYRHRVCDDKTATKVVQELQLIYHTWVEAKAIVYNDKPAVRVTSWYLDYDTIKKKIEEIINS